MRGGPLRHVLTLQRPTINRDARSQDVTAWATVATLRGTAERISGRERVSSMQTVSEATWKITTRYIPGVTIQAKDRIRVTTADGEHVLEVLTSRNVGERNRMMEIELKEHATP